MLSKLPTKFNFNFPKIMEQHRNWVLGGILIGIFLLDYFLIMQPFQIGPLIKLSPQINEKSKDLKQAKEDISKEGEYRSKVADLRKSMETVGQRVRSKEEIPKILDNISRLAIDSDVRINQIMPLRDSQNLELENDEGKYFSLSILINAMGSYHNIGRFFNRIESNPTFMSISDFDIASRNTDPTHHELRMTVKVFILEKTEGKN